MSKEEEIDYLKTHLEESKKTKYGAVWYSPYGIIYMTNKGEYNAIHGATLPEHLKDFKFEEENKHEEDEIDYARAMQDVIKKILGGND